MAHYFESGFFVREQAWHGLGTVLQNAPTTREAIVAAGLDWTVDTVPAMAQVDNDFLPIEDSRAVIRTIHQPDGSVRTEPLTTVGTVFEPLQNVDAFRFFDPILAEGNCTLEAAGSLKGGRHVWILARINDRPISVGSKADDIVCPYLLLSNAHDGTRNVTVAFTPIRVVCWNALSTANRMADKHTASTRKVRHTRKANVRLSDIRETIDLARRDFSSKALVWHELSKFALPDSNYARARIVQDYARLVFGNPAKIKEAQDKGEPLPEVRAEPHIWSLLETGPGAESAGRTAFGLYMAATHYADHEAGRTADSRLSSVWFGQGEDVRDRAEAEALKLVGVS
jgi:phage/plasmid-like protein (TIGR03299 family)